MNHRNKMSSEEVLDLIKHVLDVYKSMAAKFDPEPLYAEAAKLYAEAIEQRHDLLEALKFVRDDLEKLPRSFGYEFTHLPRINAVIDQVEANL